MNIPRNFPNAKIHLATALLLGGCQFPTSGKGETGRDPDRIAPVSAYVRVGWEIKSGLATSIGAGLAGSVYITGTDIQVNGSHSVYRWGDTSWIQTAFTAFDVDMGRSGTAAMIGNDQKIWFYTPGSGLVGPSSITASDIGATTTGHYWALGTDYIPGTSDHPIYRWVRESNKWVKTGGGGVRIDVHPDGIPYLVNANNEIYRSNQDYTYFEQFTSQKATDIGIGSDGTIWIIGTYPMGSKGDFAIYKWDGNAWHMSNGGAKRITVDSEGKPWIVNTQGVIYKGDGGYYHN